MRQENEGSPCGMFFSTSEARRRRFADSRRSETVSWAWQAPLATRVTYQSVTDRKWPCQRLGIPPEPVCKICAYPQGQTYPSQTDLPQSLLEFAINWPLADWELLRKRHKEKGLAEVKGEVPKRKLGSKHELQLRIALPGPSKKASELILKSQRAVLWENEGWTCAKQLVQKQRIEQHPWLLLKRLHRLMSATPVCTMERVEMAAASYVYYYTWTLAFLIGWK